MTAERKRWWRKVALASVGGTVVAGGLFGIVRATTPPDGAVAPAPEEATWTRAPSAPAAPLAPPALHVEHTEPGAVVPAGATLPPIPALPSTGPLGGAPVVPGVSAVQPPGGALPLPPVPTGVEPAASGPRAPDAGLLGTDKLPLPPVPALPNVGPAGVTEPPRALPATPPAPPALPAPPTAVEPPKLPAPSTGAAEPPKLPTPPALPQIPPSAPIVPPAHALEPAKPMLPVKSDSGLNPVLPGNTLNPAPPVAPPAGRDTPAIPVDRPKPPEPSFGNSDKFVFPVPPVAPPTHDLTPRDPAMTNLQHAAALAILGGAMLSAEQARSAPPVAPPTLPAVPVRADADQLKKDLEAANKKIEALEKQVARLTELLLGKKDDLGYPVPSDPGAVEETKRLKNKIADLEKDLAAMRTQTALKPTTGGTGGAAVPEVKLKGVVRIVNEYPVEISMVINDRSYPVAPGKVREVEVPVGEFTYQLLQSGAPATKSAIKDKEPVTLRIK